MSSMIISSSYIDVIELITVLLLVIYNHCYEKYSPKLVLDIADNLVNEKPSGNANVFLLVFASQIKILKYQFLILNLIWPQRTSTNH